MYKLVYSKHFEKQIKTFPQKEQVKIFRKIVECQKDPRRLSKKLATSKPPLYRIRAGEYRIFFELDNSKEIIIITGVKRRATQTYR